MWNLFIKDIKLFISDKKAMMLSFLLPIILITLFALAFGGLGSGNHKSTPTRILLTDLDNSETSREVISTLDSIKGLKFEQTSIDTLKQFIIKGHRLAGLVFYKGCEDSINQGHQKPMELFYDKSRNMEIGLVQQALIGKLMEITGSKGIKTRILSQIQNDYADLNTTTLIDIQKRVNESFNKEDNSSSFSGGLDITPIQVKKGINWGLIQAVAGTSIMMILFSMSGFGGTILEEKEKGTLKRLLHSPISPTHILLAKMLFAFVLALVQLIILFLFSWLAFGLNIFTNFLPLIIFLIAIAFACSSFGILLASISKTRKQLEGMGMLIILVMSAIGGSMIPLFIMPDIMRQIAVISINFWAIDGLYDILGRSFSLYEMLFKTGILFGIGISVSTIAIHFLKKNILKLF